MLIALVLFIGIGLGAAGLFGIQYLRATGGTLDEARRRREDERRLQHMTHVAMVQMLAEARRSGRAWDQGTDMSQGPKSLVEQLVGVCVSLMVAAIAFSVAATVIRPYIDVLAFVVLAAAALMGWRAWQRSRW